MRENSSETSVNREKELPIVRRYAWSYFRDNFARRGSQLVETEPFDFNVTMMTDQDTFLENISDQKEPWRLLFMHDIGSISGDWVKTFLDRPNRQPLYDFDELLIDRLLHIREELEQVYEIPLDSDKDSKLYQSLRGDNHQLLRIKAICSVEDSDVITLCKSMGLNIAKGESIPRAFSADRKKWIYDKLVETSKIDYSKDLLTAEVYAGWRGGEIHKLSIEKQKQFHILDSLVHKLAKSGVIRLDPDGRVIDVNHFLSSEQGIRSAIGKKIHSLITTLSGVDKSNTSGLVSGLEESVERITEHYRIRLMSQDNNYIPKAIWSEESNPGTILQTHYILSPNTRRYLVSSGQLAILYRGASLLNHRNNWEVGREINAARDVLATSDNFMQWKNGVPVDRIRFAGGKYTE